MFSAAMERREPPPDHPGVHEPFGGRDRFKPLDRSHATLKVVVVCLNQIVVPRTREAFFPYRLEPEDIFPAQPDPFQYFPLTIFDGLFSGHLKKESPSVPFAGQ